MFIYSETEQKRVYGSFEADQDLLMESGSWGYIFLIVEKEINKRWR